MKQIQDAALVEQMVEQYHIRTFFDTPQLVFCAFSWQKGEVVCSPLNPPEYLLFLVQGSIRIYDLHPDGTTLPVGAISGFSLLGDVEYVTNARTRYYLEAEEDCVCVALPLAPYREALEKDVTFLHCLLEIMADKFTDSTELSFAAGDLESRLLTYLREEAPEHRMEGVERALCLLRCSRRQLQRVLSRLCQQGRVIHLGKGRYQLNMDT